MPEEPESHGSAGFGHLPEGHELLREGASPERGAGVLRTLGARVGGALRCEAEHAKVTLSAPCSVSTPQ